MSLLLLFIFMLGFGLIIYFDIFKLLLVGFKNTFTINNILRILIISFVITSLKLLFIKNIEYRDEFLVTILSKNEIFYSICLVFSLLASFMNSCIKLINFTQYCDEGDGIYTYLFPPFSGERSNVYEVHLVKKEVFNAHPHLWKGPHPGYNKIGFNYCGPITDELINKVKYPGVKLRNLNEIYDDPATHPGQRKSIEAYRNHLKFQAYMISKGRDAEFTPIFDFMHKCIRLTVALDTCRKR